MCLYARVFTAEEPTCFAGVVDAVVDVAVGDEQTAAVVVAAEQEEPQEVEEVEEEQIAVVAVVQATSPLEHREAQPSQMESE